MLAFATSSTLASLALLLEQDIYGARGESMLAFLAVLTLVASLVVSNMNYGVRARAMEANYKRIQQLSLAAENFFVSNPDFDERRFREICAAYDAAVDASENHSEADFNRSVDGNWRKTFLDSAVTFSPYVACVFPVLLAAPIVAWFASGA